MIYGSRLTKIASSSRSLGSAARTVLALVACLGLASSCGQGSQLPARYAGLFRAEAITAARAEIKKEFPNDTYSVSDALRQHSRAGVPRWLVAFRFNNDSGRACVIVRKRAELPRRLFVREVECALYL